MEVSPLISNDDAIHFLVRESIAIGLEGERYNNNKSCTFGADMIDISHNRHTARLRQLPFQSRTVEQKMSAPRHKPSVTSALLDHGFTHLSALVERSMSDGKPLPSWMWEQTSSSIHTKPTVDDISAGFTGLDLTQSSTRHYGLEDLSVDVPAYTNASSDQRSAAVTSGSILSTGITLERVWRDKVEVRQHRLDNFYKLAAHLGFNTNLSQSLRNAIKDECLSWDGFHRMDSSALAPFRELSKADIGQYLVDLTPKYHSGRNRRSEVATRAFLIKIASDFNRKQGDEAGFADDSLRIKARLIQSGLLKLMRHHAGKPDGNRRIGAMDLERITYFATQAAAAGCTNKGTPDSVLQSMAKVIVQAKLDDEAKDHSNTVQTTQASSLMPDASTEIGQTPETTSFTVGGHPEDQKSSPFERILVFVKRYPIWADAISSLPPLIEKVLSKEVKNAERSPLTTFEALEKVRELLAPGCPMLTGARDPDPWLGPRVEILQVIASVVVRQNVDLNTLEGTAIVELAMCVNAIFSNETTRERGTNPNSAASKAVLAAERLYLQR